MRRAHGGCTRWGKAQTKMSSMSARRALVNAVRRRLDRGDIDGTPPVPWGPIGEYQGVSRQGVLFLLSPEAAHPSRRVNGSPPISTDLDAGSSAGS